MTGPVVQSHGPEGLIFDELALKRLEAEHDLCFGKEKHRYPAMQTQRTEGLAMVVLALVREVRSLRRQLDELDDEANGLRQQVQEERDNEG